MSQVQSVRVRVPATTANLGPGFDVLGLALSIWMEVAVERSETFGMTIRGEGASEIKADKTNLIVESCALAFKHSGITEMPPLKFTAILTSHSVAVAAHRLQLLLSSAAAVAGYMAGMRLCGATAKTATREALLQVISDLEGHPDNAAPAIYGGCRLGFKDSKGNTRTHAIPFPCGSVSLVLFVPDDKMKKNTHATRGLIPSTINLTDAVHNMSRTAMITLAFATNQLGMLSECLDERMHQKARARVLFPHLNKCIEGAMSAGASYAFLSGAGPTVCAIVPGRNGELQLQPPSERTAETVATALVTAAKSAGIYGRA
eukprot:CAMPEP_0176473048 /NCGR_PEP_ID=MMETSP0127-20121128/42082_1 /TAXON_ID=938130 /ORGANISM="Platyophrya macrostoma, Strain WH" /LENGTH=316 /DNA_ID=CAMNT_0017867985 /DNA_START=52 /DNA_END=999 /DNA_ORIENTATION=-